MSWQFDIMEDKGGYCRFDEILRTIGELQVNTRDHLLISTLAYSGRRKGEMRILRPMDLSIDKPSIWWYIEKKRGEKKPRVNIPIAPSVYYLLNSYASTFGILPSQYFFFGWNPEKPLSDMHVLREVKRICEEHKLYTISGNVPTPHTFRHSFAIDYVNRDHSGKSLAMLQFILQHEDIRTTMFYLQFVTTDRDDYIGRVYEHDLEIIKGL